VVSSFSSPDDLARIVLADIHQHIVDTYVAKDSGNRAAVSLSEIIPRGLLKLVLEGLSQRLQIPIGIYAQGATASSTPIQNIYISQNTLAVSGPMRRAWTCVGARTYSLRRNVFELGASNSTLATPD
jgi:hypothetical protein